MLKMACLAIMFLFLLPGVYSQSVTFTESFYLVDFAEEQPVNSSVVLLEATGFDSNFNPLSGTFTLENSADASHFILENLGQDPITDRTSAVLRTGTVFDWDQANAQNQFSVSVTFTTSAGFSSTVPVSVEITDVNDNSPQFPRPVFEVQVPEELAAGALVLNASASDPDQVLYETVTVVIDPINNVVETRRRLDIGNGLVSYSIVDGNDLGYFSLDPDTGILSVSSGAALDVDELSFYNLTIMARDGGGRNSTAMVLITILDSNDNPPVITSPRGVDVLISEETGVGYVVLDSINATDSDSSINSEIRFLIADGDPANRFRIDETTGRIEVAGDLDRELQNVYNLTVAARDGGMPPLQDIIYVVVRLQDVNDYAPQFSLSSYTVNIAENSRIGSTVAQIEAEDLDEGINGTVTYSLVTGGLDRFEVNPTTGDIITNASLDREERSLYILLLEAVDNPQNSSYRLSSQVNVTVQVLDVNDNPPVFEFTNYTVEILDNVRRSDELIQVRAMDADSGVNQQVTYSFEQSDPMYPIAFRIDEDTGIVRRNRQLSYQNQSRFIYFLQARDNGQVPAFSEPVQLTIILHDVNENPPVFDPTFYNNTISETTPIGTIVVNVTATDRDDGPIGDVRYRIVSQFDEAGSFEVDEDTGYVRVASRLDFEVRRTIHFMVEAYDGGFPQPFTDHANVSITLTGENDEAPIIVFPEGFQLFVPENVPPEVDIAVLRDYTVDPDLEHTGEFSFELAAIYDAYSDNASFSLNETTGLIRSLRTFNREEQPEGITITVTTIDFEGLTRDTNLTILIGDMNDQSPYFENTAEASVYEFLPVGTEVLSSYSAIDEDIGSNAELQYYLFSPNDRELFTINITTGGLYTAAVLNKTVQDLYNITVLVMDRGVPSLMGFGTIIVTVLDSNDMIPVFSLPLYEITFPESSSPGTVILTVNATDDDIGTNSDIRYYISSNDSNSARFSLDELSGVLTTADVFDRESESIIDLTITAVDSGLVPHPLTGSATVQVVIEDVNDHPPLFNESSYEVTVIENTMVDTVIAVVLASDSDDTSPNNLISYSLRGNRSHALGVNPELGIVFVAGELDWEEGEEFTVDVVATDRNGSILGQSSSVPLTVNIVDINDNAPEFLPSSLNLSILENSSPLNNSILVGTVMATDADSSGNNSIITYSVVMDFANGKFTLDSESGEVYFVRGNLNRERRSSYELLIRATDQGSPYPLHTDATLTIFVADANDFDPVFTQEVFSSSIPERAAIGTSVLTVNATDNDEGSNADLRFRFADYSSGDFAINEVTGIISVAGVLNFENNTIYSIPVIVSDLGNPSRNDSALVTITVTDSNDQSPEFAELQYSAVIRENLASGTVIEHVTALDNDTDLENRAIFYSILDSPGSENFGIDNTTGVVYTAASLNREQFSFYNLTIVANNSLSSYPLASVVQLTVVVTDLNDMHPTLPLITEVNVFENVTVGSTILTLDALDGDEAQNGTIEYTLLQPSEFFSLNTTTGEVILKQDLDREGSETLFILPIQMQDSGEPSLDNYTNVVVRVLDSNDNPPQFIASQYSITVSSALAVHTTFLRLMVVDTDEGSNSEFSMTIASGNELGLFEISDSGDLYTASSLSSHHGSSIPLIVQASDGTFTSDVNITVQILGRSSALPRFTRTGFSTSLSESQAQNGQEVFDFSSDTLNADTFFVDSEFLSIDNNGILTLTNSSYLDFESQPIYQITVTISDSNSGETAHEVLTLNVIDENDNSPMFISDPFLVWVPETLSVGGTVFTALALDEDGTSSNNFIQYDIDSTTDTNARSKFVIDGRTGEIQLVSGLNYESGQRSFNLTVRATNTQASSPLSSTATLEINVLNGNSFTPVFDADILTLSYPENVDVGLNIANLTATDGDLGSSGSVTYGLHGDHSYLDFRIDTFTGALFINEMLDYERSSTYTLNVIASDGGNPTRSSTAIVQVDIVDLNDNSPIWEQELYSVSVLENAAIGSSVTQVMATDRDSIRRSTDAMGNVIIIGRNGYITYSISEGDPGNYFSIDPDTGIMTVASSLDRESYPTLNITLNATDGGGLYANAYLQVIIRDFNDITPRFLLDPYVIGLSEHALEGTLVTTIMAEDSDLRRNAELRYFFFDDPSISLEDPSNTFSLNDTTGQIVLEQMVDRETVSRYVLTVVAIDMGDVQLTGTAQVVVNLLDINEFPPLFTEEMYFGEVFENSPPSTFVLQINATDVDFGENGTVYYSIISGDAGVFSIDSRSGIISVSGPIDYEMVNIFQLVVMATDAAADESVRLTNTVNVTIAVLDRNDNPPYFLDLPYIVNISENSMPGDYVLNVSASDFDSGSNSELIYSLTFPNEETGRNFVIDSITGTVTLAETSELDIETTPFYNFTVTVADNGVIPLSSSTSVSVTVTDENDNVPQFLLPFFEGTVFENLSPNTPVVNTTADDADVGSNANLTFSITKAVSGSGNCSSVGQVDAAECNMLLDAMAPLSDNPFQIDPVSGAITTSGVLDRENISSFVIQVQVEDAGMPQSLANMTFVVVEVLDENDRVPEFSQAVYFTNISEHAQSGMIIAQVEAVDSDAGSNAELTFMLLGSNKFTINMITGEILTLADDFDRETESEYNLTVIATDGGMPSLSSSAVVMVTILDENDSPPIFAEPVFTAAIVENGPPRSFVIQLNASDADIGSNSEITFSITSSSPAHHFEVDPSSGMLYTTQPLDRERFPSYTLIIMAEDGGSPSLSSTAQVEITVIDGNDFAPVFIGTPYVVTQPENSISTQPVLTLVTFDQDSGNNSDVFYSIIEVDPTINDTFVIGTRDGELSIVRPLDAEVSLFYNITIVADNGAAFPAQSSETVVLVHVTDLNDNPPVFSQPDYAVPFLESSPVGSTVIAIMAFDDDSTNENSDLTFEITGGHDRNLFNITSPRPGLGLVLVAMELDRENEPVHMLEITVFDNGSPQLNASTYLTIVLQDANDNTPVFEQSAYAFTLVENSPPLTLVGTVQANDLDLENVTYSLSDTTIFRIDSVSGEIYSAGDFDRETQELHFITAVATDTGSSMESRNSTVMVNITILDVNDNAPVFSNSTYYTQVLENTSIFEAILTVGAFDLDFEDNGTFTYSIIPGNDSSFYQINSTSGVISLAMGLDREQQDTMEFYVAATDSGTPSLASTSLVVVMILDNNDNIPVLSSPVYSASLPENSLPGTVAVQVSASDHDIAENANINFSLEGDSDRTFEVSEKDGVISLVGSLDYELMTNYSFFVVASDNGVEALHSSSLVLIEVLDLNDNSPIFDFNNYEVSIPENAILGTTVFQIPATDADSTTNGELRYSILSGNLRSVFSLDEETGVIQVAGNLDREITDSYQLTITATDQGHPQFTATANLMVSILDVNDHNPSFSSDFYSTLISESARNGTAVFRFEASDLDIGPNADLTFSIVAGNDDDVFEISPRTGELFLVGRLNLVVVPSYALTILVSDSGSPDQHRDTAIIRIIVLDTNSHPPSFALSEYFMNISQALPVGTPIGHFAATDEDDGVLAYSLVNSPDYFIVDSLDGSLYINRPLEPGSFNLSLETSDGMFVTDVTITVTVVPTSGPITLMLFDSPSYYFEILETAGIGAIVGRISPVGEFTSDSMNLFTIRSNGDVVVSGFLDTESTPYQVLNVVHRESVTGPIYAIVTIKIVDVNDNNPQFESEMYRITLSEATIPGSSVAILQAFDLDSTRNSSAITLSLSSQGNEEGLFILDATTGTLSTNGLLDYELAASYNLTVLAVNNLGSPMLSSAAEILISVVDVNDNSPVFSQPFYQASIPESSPVGSEVIRLEASDPDSGSNSELIFSITHINVPLIFTINQSTGAIFTNTRLDLEEETSYVVGVRVADRGNPQPLAASTVVFVEVTPHNMGPPLFSQPGGYEVEIPETLSVGDPVIQISATDDSSSSELTYSVTSPEAAGTFLIDSLTGIITLESALDYNVQSFYTLSVQVTDNGDPPLFSVTSVNITVQDVNNHAPVFDQRSYQVSLLENVTIGAPVVRVTASDEDSAGLTYVITRNYRNGLGRAAFSMNSTTGEITTAASLDRETDEVIDILVTAIDSGYDIVRSNSIPVVIQLLDVNDNPPIFPSGSIRSPLLRLLSAGMMVVQVQAMDADLVGSNLTYEITADDSNGLFEINPVSGVVMTRRPVNESIEALNLQISAFDGVFTTILSVQFIPEDNGDFCEDNGYCTSVRQVDCMVDILLQIQCVPYCEDANYALSPAQRVCMRHYCMNSSLVPCVATESCLPPDMGCNGVCPSGMSLCPTTDICHTSTLSESCDNSGITCLIDRSLVQRSDQTRYCAITDLLPSAGQNCDNGSIYCEDLGACMSLSDPDLCQECPGQLLPCPGTSECVTELVRCCASGESFCEVLRTCLNAGLRCELPNIAPENTRDLYYLGSVSNYSSESNSSIVSIVIYELFGNETDMAVDSQGEELSIAITGASSLSPTYGEWQFSLINSSSWIRIDHNNLSDTHALVLPSTASVRFMRKAVELDGAVWVRVKLWDGNEDGYISPSDTLVRSLEPSFVSTLPYSPTSAFSLTSSLLVVLSLPLNSPPSFLPSSNQWNFSDIIEDMSVGLNLGDVLYSVVSPIYNADFSVLPTTFIEGFPSSNYEQLLPEEVRNEYFSVVRNVNPTRVQRQMAPSMPGVAVTFDPETTDKAGIWQIALQNNPQKFVNLASVITHQTTALLDTNTRLRFLSRPDFCGTASILLAPWDGYWSSSTASSLPSGYIVSNLPPSSDASSSTRLSIYNVASWERGVVEVTCVPDPPVIENNRILTSIIPYQITHVYKDLFTILVDREETSVRVEESMLAIYLQIILRHPVNIYRISPTAENKTMVSFMVENSALTFDSINMRLSSNLETLARLNFDVQNLSQAASYGPGASCQEALGSEYYGDSVRSLAAASAGDTEQTNLGLAVVGSAETSNGVWQYQRFSWMESDSLLSEGSSSGSWVNLPSSLSPTSAFLLHGDDRLRFLPYPEYFWTNNSVPLPYILVKVWDMSLSSYHLPLAESFAVNVNTDPQTDTLQSLHRPIGLFSSISVTIEAARVGCDGVVNSGLVHDACCVCGGEGVTCNGCDGRRGSNRVQDSCNICGGLSSCLGCDLVPFSRSEPGQCSVCVSEINAPSPINITLTDCNGDCFGSAISDDCGICSGGNTDHAFNSDIDCTGSCFGGAVVDNCGNCTGPGTDLAFNQNLDCTGVCGGFYREDSCGVCQLPGTGGSVREFRDCSGQCFGSALLDSCGICYGGSTNVTEGSALDACGMCHGDNSTCTGCDGVINSGVEVDRCGECGGNNCGCFLLHSIIPNVGPIAGGTSVLVQGAGLFLNNTALLGFQFDRNSPNCGAPMRFRDSSIIPIRCQFQSSGEQLPAQATPIDQGSVICRAPASASPGLFTLEVSVNGGPFSSPLEFTYYDQFSVAVNSFMPADWLINTPPVVAFKGEGFINSSAAACLIYNSHRCSSPVSQPPVQGYVIVPAQFVSTEEMTCILPPASVPCRISVQLSLDGQESGTIRTPTVLDFTYRFSSPRVTSASFLDDLSGVSFVFDREVVSVPSELSCIDIFDEETFVRVGSSGASCTWLNNKQDTLILTLPSNGSIQIGSPITFKNGAFLTRGQQYSFSNENLTVYAEAFPTEPIAVINGPDSIPYCGQFSFTGMYSEYPGYSGFQYIWSILVDNSTIDNFLEVQNYFVSLDARQASTITLNSSFFLPFQVYYLNLYVINGVGLQSEVNSLRLVKDSNPRPDLFVVGAPERNLTSGEDLFLESIISVPECLASEALQFEWELVRILDQRRSVTLTENIMSVRHGSQQIFIPSRYLMEGSKYRVHVRANFVETTSQAAAALVNVTVAPKPLVIRIHGGSRTVSSERQLVLDARNSTYSSVLEPPSFSWRCEVVGSTNACFNTSTQSNIPTPIALPKSAFVDFPASTIASNSSYIFTLTVEQEGRLAERSVRISVVGTLGPIVEVSSTFLDVLVSEELSLFGFVYSTMEFQSVQWESIEIEGQGFVDLLSPFAVQSMLGSLPSSSSLTVPSFAAEPNFTSRVNLILSPNTLDPNLLYTFRLSATDSIGSSYAEVTIRANSPPKYAALLSIPSSGSALETEFELLVTGALDSLLETPLLYQFGIVLSESPTGIQYLSSQGDLLIQWLTVAQVSPFLQTVLPSGDEQSNFALQLIARVYDRNGGFSDFFLNVTVSEAASPTTEFFHSGINRIQRSLNRSKDWSRAISELTAFSIEANKHDSMIEVATVKELSLLVFLDIFDTYLPVSSNHLPLATSLLSIISANFTTSDTNLKRMVSERLREISEWYRNETILTQNYGSVPLQDSNEPLFLQGSYLSPEREILSVADATALLFPWTQLLDEVSADSVVQTDFLQAVESVSNVLCQQSSIGEHPSLVSLPSVSLHTVVAPPMGLFNASGYSVDFGSSVMDEYYKSQSCVTTGVVCSETCFVAMTYPNPQDNVATRQTVQLNQKSIQKLGEEIEGSDPSKLELVSSIVSVSIHIPSEQSYLAVKNLSNLIQIHIPVVSNISENGSILLCLYREVGGGFGFQNLEWQLDDTAPPVIVKNESMTYYLCSFNHLTEFAVGLLPPPVITDPPTTEPETTPAVETTETTQTEEPTIRETEAPQPVSGSPVGAIVAVVMVLLVVGVVIAVLLILFFVWRQKKKKKMKVSPDESDKVEPDPVELVQAGPLTPAESKVLMDIIQCMEEGKRTRLGKLNVLPSIRLRELRHEIIENFPTLKNKPFYFLTRQLCDIEPTTEQQQFVSIVFGEKPIFIREVVSESMQTKKHFCICGNAAQFECSNCSSQGYCSEECQNQHWNGKHQKECGRLSERKRRADVLQKWQSTVSPHKRSLAPISETEPRNSVGELSPAVVAAASNWKSFMQKRNVSVADLRTQQSQFPPRSRTLSVPGRDATTLGGLSRQMSLPQVPQVANAQPAPGAPSNFALRPVKNIPLTGNQGSGQVDAQKPSLSRMSNVVGKLASLSPQKPQSLPPRPSVASLGAPAAPPQQLFIRQQPPREVSRPPPVRQLSIQSIGSPISPTSIRNEPLLVPPEESESLGRSQDGNISRLSSDSRPPTLAVRKKGQRRADSSSESSSLSSTDSESSEESDTNTEDRN